ncbi:MAG: L-threonine 3-dehydrogenase [Parachlamydiaceae bacterium]
MKALVKRERKEGLWMEDVPKPTIGDHDVLIKVKKSSICGTDVHIWKWDAWAQKTIPVPMVVGHEFMGMIVEVGSAVKNLKVGQRVSGEGHITCGVCPNCRKGLKHICVNTLGVGVNRPGSFAEYVSLPAENVFPLPDSIPDELAAIFDPFGNATHTALSFDLVGEDVLITGAGPIGIMAAAIARHAGARNVVITDLNDQRLQIASTMGATKTVNVGRESLAEETKKLGLEFGYTVGLEMSGHPSGLNNLLQNMMHGGKVALLGILPPNTQIDWDLVIFKMLQIKGIYGREIFSTWYKMAHMLESGLNLSPVITHHFPIDEFEKGFEIMIAGHSGKVILDW